MTPFLAAGITGYNFAFIGNSAQYHTSLDRRENLDPRSLQQHGENALGVTQALRGTDLDRLKSENAIYLDVLGAFLPRLPARWSLPLSLCVFFLIAWAGRKRFGLGGGWRSFVIPPLLVIGAVGVGFILHSLAAWISGEPDPSFARPLLLRLSLAFGVLRRRAVGGARRRRDRLLALACRACCCLCHLGAGDRALFPVSLPGGGTADAVEQGE
jgi:hypothetical protein